MTMPAPVKPASSPPVLKRVVSNPIFSDGEAPIIWAIRAPHPLVPEYTVIRMFIDLGGVEIYSVSSDSRNGIRNIIPTSKIRFTEEAMSFDVFREELDAAAYAGAPVGPLSTDDDDDEEEEDPNGNPEPEDEEPYDPNASNGPTVTS
jgi:hypothetical protein